MKLTDVTEMTMRTGANMDSMPFPEFEKYNPKFVGKMQHGYEVYSFDWSGTTLYGVKIGNEFASFTQVRMINVPKIGQVVESLNTKTKKEYAGQLLSYKLRYFLNKHLGVSILLGNIHSIATEKVLPKVTHLFDLKLVNIKTGEVVDWSDDNYRRLTSMHSTTDWQVLMVGNSQPFNEDVDRMVGWSDDNRHMWTYGDYFEGMAENDD